LDVIEVHHAAIHGSIVRKAQRSATLDDTVRYGGPAESMVRVEQVENVRADFTHSKSFLFFLSAVLASKVLAFDLFGCGPFTGRWTSPPWDDE
jgi:hypothetical protein